MIIVISIVTLSALCWLTTSLRREDHTRTRLSLAQHLRARGTRVHTRTGIRARGTRLRGPRIPTRAQDTRTDEARSIQVAQPPEAAAVSSVDTSGLTWSALDDVQLTRLLIDAARQTNTD